MNVEIDDKALSSIREIGGDDLLAKLIELFNDYIAGRITAAKEALQQGDWPGVQDAVHPIKSSAANLGATRVRDLARQIEQLAKQKSTGEIPGLVTMLEQAFAEAREELQRKSGKRAG